MPEQYNRLIGGGRLVKGYECNSSVAPTLFDRLISGYRRTQTALLGDPCCTSLKTGPQPTLSMQGKTQATIGIATRLLWGSSLGEFCTYKRKCSQMNNPMVYRCRHSTKQSCKTQTIQQRFRVVSSAKNNNEHSDDFGLRSASHQSEMLLPKSATYISCSTRCSITIPWRLCISQNRKARKLSIEHKQGDHSRKS